MTLAPHFPYVHLDEPTRGKADGKVVYITDVSIDGVQVLHQSPLSSESPMIEFSWSGSTVQGKGTVKSTHPVERKTQSGVQHLQSSQVDLEDLDPQGKKVLQDLVEHHLERALDERRSNARGVPVATGASWYRTASARSGYIIWQLNADGSWTSADSDEPAQPSEGFTVSKDENDEEVSRLREVYAESDRSRRDLIRKMAELSVSEKAGVPTRRYTP